MIEAHNNFDPNTISDERENKLDSSVYVQRENLRTTQFAQDHVGTMLQSLRDTQGN